MVDLAFGIGAYACGTTWGVAQALDWLDEDRFVLAHGRFVSLVRFEGLAEERRADLGAHVSALSVAGGASIVAADQSGRVHVLSPSLELRATHDVPGAGLVRAAGDELAVVVSATDERWDVPYRRVDAMRLGDGGGREALGAAPGELADSTRCGLERPEIAPDLQSALGTTWEGITVRRRGGGSSRIARRDVALATFLDPQHLLFATREGNVLAGAIDELVAGAPGRVVASYPAGKIRALVARHGVVSVALDGGAAAILRATDEGSLVALGEWKLRCRARVMPSPSGARAVASLGDDDVTTLRSMASLVPGRPKPLVQTPRFGSITAVAMLEDAALFATGDGRLVRIGRDRTIARATKLGAIVALAAAGDHVVATGTSTLLLDAATLEERGAHGAKAGEGAGAWSDARARVVVFGRRGATALDLASGAELGKIKAVDADQDVVAAALVGDAPCLVDEAGNLVGTKLDARLWKKGELWCARFLADGALLVASERDGQGRIELRGLRPAKVLASWPVGARVLDAVRADDGTLAYVTATELVVRREGAAEVRVPAPPGIARLQIAPSGALVAATCQVDLARPFGDACVGEARVYDSRDGALLGRFLAAPRGIVGIGPRDAWAIEVAERGMAVRVDDTRVQPIEARALTWPPEG